MRVLLISTERVGARMAAGGIRYVELARALSAVCEVTLLAPEGSEPVDAWPRVQVYDPGAPEALPPVDVVFAPPLVPRLAARAVRSGRPWLVDLINPEPFEGLEYHRRRRRWERSALATLRLDRLGYALRRGFAFACATERQRDMWLGMLAASRRLGPARYEADPELRGLIDVLPPGIDPTPPPAPGRPVLRGVTVPEGAHIVLWNGGVWDWFDPDTAMDAVEALHARDPRWRLVFMSIARPSSRGAMGASERVASRAGEAIQVNHDWVPYAERAAQLLEADVCVSTHRVTLESRFAYRNRLLDCIWAGLPIVCTEGDVFADLVAEHGWGAVVPPQDAAGLADALEAVCLAGRESVGPSMAAYREQHTWAAVATALHQMAGRALDDSRRPRRLDPVAAGARARHTVASLLRRPG